MFEVTVSALGRPCAIAIWVLSADGTAACWGDNTSGQNTAPAGTFIQISAGARHSCGLRSDGYATCWGDLVTPDR
jgi:hypothetical protein